MKRQRYFPSTIAGRPEWFGNFATQIAIHNAVLNMDPVEVADIIKDAKYCAYICGDWLTAAREFGPAATASINDLLDGSGSDPFVPLAFTPPGPPTGVTAVPPGALERIFIFVKAIKTRPGYTNTIGLQLGIVGQEDASEHLMPEFNLKLERQGTGACQCVRINFTKFGRQGVVIFSRRGGGDWEMLAIDLSSPYLDGRPLLSPGVPEVREYRLQFYDDATATGPMTDIATITVAP